MIDERLMSKNLLQGQYGMHVFPPFRNFSSETNEHVHEARHTWSTLNPPPPPPSDITYDNLFNYVKMYKNVFIQRIVNHPTGSMLPQRHFFRWIAIHWLRDLSIG